MTDRRTFTPLTCHYCPESPVWCVTEWEWAEEEINVCEKHKFSPFS